jgi:hypothetical protein
VVVIKTNWRSAAWRVLLQVYKVAQNPSGVEGCKCLNLWGYDAEILAIPSFYFPSFISGAEPRKTTVFTELAAARAHQGRESEVVGKEPESLFFPTSRKVTRRSASG